MSAKTVTLTVDGNHHQIWDIPDRSVVSAFAFVRLHSTTAPCCPESWRAARRLSEIVGPCAVDLDVATGASRTGPFGREKLWPRVGLSLTRSGVAVLSRPTKYPSPCRTPGTNTTSRVRSISTFKRGGRAGRTCALARRLRSRPRANGTCGRAAPPHSHTDQLVPRALTHQKVGTRGAADPPFLP